MTSKQNDFWRGAGKWTARILIALLCAAFVNFSVNLAHDSGRKVGIREGRAETISDVQLRAALAYINCIEGDCATERAAYEFSNTLSRGKTQ